jgi:hypothetical protein
MHVESKAAEEAAKALDALAALSVELACHCEGPPDQLVLGAAKLKETCATIDEAVASLKHILAVTQARDGPLLGTQGTP